MTHSLPTSSNTALATILGAGWSFPVAREGSPDTGTARVAKLAMASDEISVHQSIEIILSTSKGERAMRPDFGCDLNKLLFESNNRTTHAIAKFEVEEALKMWEPRIEVLDVSVRADDDHRERLLIDVSYRMRSTDNRFNLVYPFYLDRTLV